MYHAYDVVGEDQGEAEEVHEKSCARCLNIERFVLKSHVKIKETYHPLPISTLTAQMPYHNFHLT